MPRTVDEVVDDAPAAAALSTAAMPAPVAARSRPLQRNAFVLVVLVIIATGLSPVPVPLAFEHQDKLHHLFGFTVLVLSGRLAFPRLRPSGLALGCLALALGIEVGQGLMSTRSASLIDMAANLLGVGAGLALARLLRPRRLSREEAAG